MSVAQSVSQSVAAGIAVVPPAEDGSKRPDLSSWRQYTRDRPSDATIAKWYARSRDGLGWICGAVSGGLEVIDFDDRGAYHAFRSAAQDAGLGDLVERIESGYLEETPRGIHWPYYCDTITGSLKLARDGKRSLIETRGEGGFVIVAPSHGGVCPDGGEYRRLRGSPATIARITPEERQDLHRLARTFDRSPLQARDVREASSQSDRPGDRMAASMTWPEILEPAGWVRVSEREDVISWRRPGKDRGISATTGYGGSDLLYVFSTSTELPSERGIGKFGAYAQLYHGGDFGSAARAIARTMPEYTAAPALRVVGDDEADDWTGRLVRSGRGALLGSVGNVLTILANDPRWSGVLAWDELAYAVSMRGDPPWGDDERVDSTSPIWSDTDTTRLQSWLLKEYRLSASAQAAYEAARCVAERARVHPIRDYLSSLQWDGTHRIGSWLCDYLGCSPDPDGYVDAVGRYFLIGAVARGLKPGSKVDTMLVLEGAQGRRKSSALRALFGADLFSDTPPDLASKDRFVALQGLWCLEIAELDGLSRADVGRVKSYLSSSSDKYRPPYARGVVSVPRSCVIAGTCNEAEYLSDPTGNRRYWPVRVGAIDADAIARDRDQLWAEAVAAYEDGDRWWPARAEEETFAAEAGDRMHSDPWEGAVRDAIDAAGEASAAEILDRLRIERGRQTRGDAMRVARIARALGYAVVRRRAAGGVRERAWTRSRGLV